MTPLSDCVLYCSSGSILLSQRGDKLRYFPALCCVCARLFRLVAVEVHRQFVASLTAGIEKLVNFAFAAALFVGDLL